MKHLIMLTVPNTDQAIKAARIMEANAELETHLDLLQVDGNTWIVSNPEAGAMVEFCNLIIAAGIHYTTAKLHQVTEKKTYQLTPLK